MVMNLQIRQLMRINRNIITIVKTIELLINIDQINKQNVCAYTFWSVLEINTGFRRHQRNLRRRWLWSGRGNTSSPLLWFLLPVSVFLVPPGSDLVMHRLDGDNWMLICVDMQFLGMSG